MAYETKQDCRNSLPVELWQIILSHFDLNNLPMKFNVLNEDNHVVHEETIHMLKERNKALYSLSLVNSVLHELCAPLLYSCACNLWADRGKMERPDPHETQLRTSLLVRTLIVKPRLRNHVKSCITIIGYQKMARWLEPQFPEEEVPQIDALFVAILTLCPNIEFVRFYGMLMPQLAYFEDRTPEDWLSALTGPVRPRHEHHDMTPLNSLKSLQSLAQPIVCDGIHTSWNQIRSVVSIGCVLPFSMTRLQLADFSHIGEIGLKAILSKFGNLTILEIDWDMALTRAYQSVNYDRLARLVQAECPRLQVLTLRHPQRSKYWKDYENFGKHAWLRAHDLDGSVPGPFAVFKDMVHLQKLTIGYIVFNYWATVDSLANVLPVSLKHLVLTAMFWDPLSTYRTDQPDDGPRKSDAQFISRNVIWLITSEGLDQLSTIDLEYFPELDFDVTPYGWRVEPQYSTLEYEWIFRDDEKGCHWETWCLRLQRC